MKTRFALLALALAAVAFSGCSGGVDTAPTAPTPTPAVLSPSDSQSLAQSLDYIVSTADRPMDKLAVLNWTRTLNEQVRDEYTGDDGVSARVGLVRIGLDTLEEGRKDWLHGALVGAAKRLRGDETVTAPMPYGKGRLELEDAWGAIGCLGSTEGTQQTSPNAHFSRAGICSILEGDDGATMLTYEYATSEDAANLSAKELAAGPQQRLFIFGNIAVVTNDQSSAKWLSDNYKFEE